MTDRTLKMTNLLTTLNIYRILRTLNLLCGIASEQRDKGK